MEEQSGQLEEREDTAEPAAPANRAVLHDYITRQELAEQLGVHVKTLEAWERRRVGPPCQQIGKRIYYHVPAVRAWLEDRNDRRAGSRAARQKRGR
jgi:hypothetical protein